jgi:5-methylcytosine-specific restriction enzyme A
MIQVSIRRSDDDLLSVYFSEQGLTSLGFRVGDFVRVQIGGTVLEGQIRSSPTNFPWLATRGVDGWSYQRITDLLRASGLEAGDDVQADVFRVAPFRVGGEYTRKDIYRILEVPEAMHGGDWDTGYHKYGNDGFVFANVGAPGRTGHDYANHWVGSELVWRGKRGSRLHHPSIQDLLSGTGRVYVFARTEARAPFVFEGSASASSFEDIEPVKVVWSFEGQPDSGAEIAPEEVSPKETYPEGSVQRRLVNAYERNPAARRACLAHWGTACLVCGFDFGSTYGELGEGYIHVHHLVPIATIGDEYDVDPVQDLRPVCPNCHVMIHMGGTNRAIEEVQAIIQASQGKGL